MAEIKAAQADAFCEKPDKAFRIYLVYGPDSGLVSERADLIASKMGVDASDPFSLIRIDADHAAADRSRLADEANTIGMFGGSRLIRVSGTTRRNLSEALKPVLDNPPLDSWLIVEAGDLKRDAALRRIVERSGSGVAIPCYADDDRAIDRLISSELQAARMNIDPDAREALRANLGSDRRASRNEIGKLILYAYGRSQITLEDVRAIVGDVSALEADDILDAAVDGEVKLLEQRLAKADRAAVSPDMLALQGLRLFQMLQVLRYRMETTRAAPGELLRTVRPGVHFSRTGLIERAIRGWTADRIEKVLTRLEQASFDARANPQLGWAIVGRVLLAVALDARRSNSRSTRS